MTIQDAVTNFKDLIENSIIVGGNESKTAMIRSSVPILNLHDAVKHQLISRGVNPGLICPLVGHRSPELKLAGSLKQKDQDVCVKPNSITPTRELLQSGLLQGVNDPYGNAFTEKTLAVNVRSQISSISKNFDTLYERTISEAQNLHDRCSNMVLGELYMIAIPEYDDKQFGKNICSYKNVSQNMVEKYIKSFHAITGRDDSKLQFDYQYEATCLLIVDFRQNPPKIYNSTAELQADGFLPLITTVQYEGLDWNSFSTKLLSIYDSRFGIGNLS